MSITYVVIGVIIAVVLLEIVKHLFFKKTAKLIMFAFILLILFLLFSYTFKDVETFHDNKFIQTGAVMANKLGGILKEKVDAQAVINSTVKSNELFKS